MFDQHTLTLWAYVVALKILIFALTFRGRYPIFQTYIGISLVKSLTLWAFTLSANETAYYWGYYYGSYLEYGLQFGVVLHMVRQHFCPLWILPRSVFRTALISVVFLLGAILLLGIQLSSSRHFAPFKVIERLSLVMLLSGVLITAALTKHLSIPWRNRQSWIALGLFVYLLLSCTNPNYTPAFLIAELCWLAGFILPETQTFQPSLSQLQELVTVAGNFLPPKKTVQGCAVIEQKAKVG
jgi:hypothetical protein